MLIAITGGTGFVGRALVHVHTKRGDHVRILSRHPHDHSAPYAVTMYRGDLLSSINALSKFVDGADILYHCAGEIRKQDNMFPVHVTGTKNLCAAASGRIGHWVQLSSVGAYGPQASGVVTEETPLNPVGTYEITKTSADQIVLDAHQECSFSYSILRPSNIYGPTMNNQSIFKLIRMIDKGFFFFIGKVGAAANYIHVDNVAEALMLCGTAQTSRGEVFNLSDNCTLEEFVTIIADELGCTTPRLRLPEQPVRWLARILEQTGIPRFPLTASRINAMTTRSVYSIQKIQNMMGYVHRIKMEEGIRQLVRAWKQFK